MRRPCPLLALLVLAHLGGCGSEASDPGAKGSAAADLAKQAADPAGRPPGQGTGAAKPAGPTVTVPPVTYPDTDAGLRQLATDLLGAARRKDDTTLARLLESLRLRNPDQWFETSFGKALGRELAGEYKLVRDEIGHLTALLERLAADGQNRLTIERFDQPDQPAAVGYQSAALAKMAKRTPLLSVRFAGDDRKLFHLWSFVYQEGSFRYVGKMKRSVEAPPSGDRDVLEFRVADAERVRSAGK